MMLPCMKSQDRISQQLSRSPLVLWSFSLLDRAQIKMAVNFPQSQIFQRSRLISVGLFHALCPSEVGYNRPTYQVS